MIGNDIVDFQKAALESNWQRKGYLDKLFCLEEQNLIFDSINPNQVVWLLWSMKEAGYKIYSRHKEVRTYQPKKITCSNLLINKNSASGQIHYDGQNYFCKSILNTEFVHTSAVIHSSVFKRLSVFIENNEAHNNSLNDSYQDFINANYLIDYTVIKSCHRVPSLLNKVTGEKQALSISHHGRFLSLIFVSNNNYS